MTFVYTKAFLLWLVIFPFLCVVNLAKAVLDFAVWIFDLPTNVWEFCMSLSGGAEETDNGARKDGGNI